MDDEDLVMRSVYLRPTEDSKLRQLAHELNVSKSDLIRSAISVKLREWLTSSSDKGVLRDLDIRAARQRGGPRRGGSAGRSQAIAVAIKLTARGARSAKPQTGRAKPPAR